MKATLIDSNGEVIGVLEAPDQEHIIMNVPEGGSYTTDLAPENSYRVGDGWVIKPVPPNIYCRWDAVLKVWNDPRNLDQLKEAKWQEIKLARDIALTDFLTTPYGVFDATEKSQKAITDAVLMLQTLASLGTPSTIDFTLADNTIVEMDVTQVVQLGLMLGVRTQTVRGIATVLRTSIEAATTMEALQSIHW